MILQETSKRLVDMAHETISSIYQKPFDGFPPNLGGVFDMDNVPLGDRVTLTVVQVIVARQTGSLQ